MFSSDNTLLILSGDIQIAIHRGAQAPPDLALEDASQVTGLWARKACPGCWLEPAQLLWSWWQRYEGLTTSDGDA